MFDYSTNLQGIANKITKISIVSKNDEAIVSLVLGVIFSLLMSSKYQFDMKEFDKNVIMDVANSIATNKEISQTDWLANFYFNDALNRLGSLLDRLELGSDIKAREVLNDEWNTFKHEIGGLIKTKRKVSFEKAFGVLSRLVDVIPSLLPLRDE